MGFIWKKWVKPAFIIIYVVGLCVGLPFIILNLKNEPTESMRFACFVGGFFVLGAIPISLWTILEHLTNYSKPYLQRNIIRILWMVPIYATNAWFALRFPHTAIYFDTLRECYEAYAIYNFLAFLLNYLKREYPELNQHLEEKQQVKHIPPLCCFRPWPMGSPFIEHCRHGVLQYTVIRPITTIIALICEVCGVYGETKFSYRYAYVYLTIINNISQVWALYCLVLFYQCTKAELKPMNPVSKFVCVKFVVFMSFWQSVLISILAASGIIEKVEAWKLYDVRSIGIALQNFAICIEMFIAAVAHHFAFSVAPYRDTSIPRSSCCTSWWSMLDVSDVKRDVVQHVRHVGSRVGFIGSDGRFSGPPRTAIVPGLSKSRAMTAHVGEEFSPLMPHTGPTSSQRKRQKKRRQERQHRRSSEGLSPDTPGPSSDSDYVGSDEDFHATDLSDLSGRPALLPISQASNDLSRTVPSYEEV